MSKIIDITDKLNFEEKPRIRIKNIEAQVNNDAPTVLKVTALFEDGKIGTAKLLQVYELLFSENEREKIDSLKLSFEDFGALLINTAMAVAGVEEEEGEARTPAMT